MVRSSTLPRRLALALVLWTIPGMVGGEIRTDPRAAMSEAMTKMMEAMGMFNPSTAAPMPMEPPVPLPGTSPWMGAPMDPSGAMEKGGEMMRQFSDGMNIPEAAGMSPWPLGSRLEGIWEGRDGELLIVRGNRFRIYPGNAGYVDGYLQLRGERLAMYNPESADARPFEFAESKGRLVLRDAAGTVYLYRRLWMDEGRGAEAMTLPRPSTPGGGLTK